MKLPLIIASLLLVGAGCEPTELSSYVKRVDGCNVLYAVHVGFAEPVSISCVND